MNEMRGFVSLLRAFVFICRAYAKNFVDVMCILSRKATTKWETESEAEKNINEKIKSFRKILVAQSMSKFLSKFTYTKRAKDINEQNR